MLNGIELEFGYGILFGLFSFYCMVVFVFGFLCKFDDVWIVIVREWICYYKVVFEQYKQNSSEKNGK